MNSKDAIEKVFASKDSFKRLTIIDKFAATSKLSFLKQVWVFDFMFDMVYKYNRKKSVDISKILNTLSN